MANILSFGFLWGCEHGILEASDQNPARPSLRSEYKLFPGVHQEFFYTAKKAL
jgi:hypothetical protein